MFDCWHLLNLTSPFPPLCPTSGQVIRGPWYSLIWFQWGKLIFGRGPSHVCRIATTDGDSSFCLQLPWQKYPEVSRQHPYFILQWDSSWISWQKCFPFGDHGLQPYRAQICEDRKKKFCLWIAFGHDTTTSILSCISTLPVCPEVLDSPDSTIMWANSLK